MDNQHFFLKLSAKIIRILSYVLGGLGVVGALVILFGKTPRTGKWASIGTMLFGCLYFFTLYLLSEMIRLFIVIDERLQKIETAVQTPKREIL